VSSGPTLLTAGRPPARTYGGDVATSSSRVDSCEQHKGNRFSRNNGIFMSTDCTVEKLAEVFQGRAVPQSLERESY